MTVYKTRFVYMPDNRVNIPIYARDVFARTEQGDAEIRSGSTSLTANTLVILVLIDGCATVGDIEQKAAHMPQEQLRDLLRSLLGNGLIRTASLEEAEGVDFEAFFAASRGEPKPSSGATASAEREASAGGPLLKREGYYVSIARRAVVARKPEDGTRLRVLVVEDDEHMAKLVMLLLKNAGFAVNAAANRSQIMAQLSQRPVPDAIVLDITLGDANGFEVLQALKKARDLKAVPVIMMTADARQESIVRGLVGGADGYVTKPFEPKILVAGIKAILGM